jgi:hypothetical protein
MFKLLAAEGIFTSCVLYYLRSDWPTKTALNTACEIAAGCIGFLLLGVALHLSKQPFRDLYPEIARNLNVTSWIALLSAVIPIAVGVWSLLAGRWGSGASGNAGALDQPWITLAIPIPLLALAVVTAALPDVVGRALGAAAIVYLAGSVFFAATGAARRLLRELNARKIGPVWLRDASQHIATAVVIWFVAGLSMYGHEVRHGSTERAVLDQLRSRSTKVSDAVDRWWQENRGPDDKATMILIATAGGGIRAGYWTSAVLAKLDQIKGFREHLFAISSVSGGSLGAGLFRTAIIGQARQTGPCSKPDESQCFKSFFSNDFLGPLLAGYLFSDVLSTFFPFLPLPDRAAAIELSWEAAWRASFGDNLLASDFHTLWEVQSTDPYWPLLLVNATALESGNRVLVSPIFPSGSPAFLGSTRVQGVMQVTPMPTSTVLNLSARFPILEPPGLLTSPGAHSEKKYVGNFVDGGYADNFGAMTLNQLIDEIHFLNCQHVHPESQQRCTFDRGYVPAPDERWIFPVVIQITSDPSIASAPLFSELCMGAPGPIPPNPSLIEPADLDSFASIEAPLLTLYNVRTGIGFDAAQQLSRQVYGLYLHYGLTRELGPTKANATRPDPSLNWILSLPSRAWIETHLSQCDDLQFSLLERAIESPRDIGQLKAEQAQAIKKKGAEQLRKMGVALPTR